MFSHTRNHARHCRADDPVSGQHQPAILQPAAAGEQDRIPYTLCIAWLRKSFSRKDNGYINLNREKEVRNTL